MTYAQPELREVGTALEVVLGGVRLDTDNPATDPIDGGDDFHTLPESNEEL